MVAKTKSAEVEPLSAYVARMEDAAQPFVVTKVTHPGAVDGAIHEGKYAGIRLVRGDDIGAVLSNGTVI